MGPADWGEDGDGAERPMKSAPHALVEVDPLIFERVLLTREMLDDHIPDSYLAAIQRLT